MEKKTEMDRRKFMKFLGGGVAAGVGVTLTATPGFAKSKSKKGQGKPKYAMVINTPKCIGCMACVAACKSENNVPLGVTRTRVQDAERGTYPKCYRIFTPELCNQCENPPCIPVCPVDATFRNPDGLVVIDQKKCISCGMCVKSCPYNARFINEMAKAADKCDLCEKRRAQGLQPACVEVCTTNSRVLGKVGEKDTQFAKLSSRKDLSVLKAKLGTKPAFKYVGL